MSLPKPLKCSDVGHRDVLMSLIRHELSSEREDQILSHLRSCPHCLSKLAELISDTGIPGLAGEISLKPGGLFF